MLSMDKIQDKKLVVVECCLVQRLVELRIGLDHKAGSGSGLESCRDL